MNFESLVAHIRQLSQSDKNKIMEILKESHLPIIEEEQTTYSKSQVTNDFEQKWSESITTEEFKKAVIQHIDHLPWK